jgi:flagellar hook-associated protein 3 FlgL
MRISTAGLMQGHTESLARLQAGIQKTQAQVSSGIKLQSAADDPVAAARIQESERWLLAAEQHERNGDMVGSRLELQEGAIADAADILLRVRELAVQGGNGALDRSARRILATEVRSSVDQLMQIANRRSPSGEHLFAGGSSSVEPFVRDSGVIRYTGDDQQRLVEVAPGQRIADALPGSEVFVQIPAGNASFALRSGTANAGTAVLGAGSLIDPTAWDGEPYRVLIMANGDWEARDAADALVASGPYGSGDAIEYKGVRITLTGSPIAGDQFFIDPSGTEDLFATFERLAAALEAPISDPTQRASSTNELNAALAQLGQGQERLSGARAVVGARLSAVDTAAATRSVLREDVAKSLSQLRDTDYAEALARLNMQMAGLQAAQQSVARLSRMSLFDYL